MEPLMVKLLKPYLFLNARNQLKVIFMSTIISCLDVILLAVELFPIISL